MLHGHSPRLSEDCHTPTDYSGLK